MNYFHLFFLVFLLVFNQSVYSQQSKLSKAVNYLSNFISSEYFSELKCNNSDLALTDTIYIRAVKFTNYDYSEALLSLIFTTVPYKRVPIKLPLINVIVKYPLISASDSIFNKKNDNLPKNLFLDTPNDNFGDKDKLAHFFGSAYISYSSHIFDLGNLIGYFIEVFEDSFKVQSQIDFRDMRANLLGQYFGKYLKEDKNFLPSKIFLFYNLSNIIFTL